MLKIDNIHEIIDAGNAIELSQSQKKELSDEVSKIYHPRIKMFPRGTIDDAIMRLHLYVRVNEKETKYPLFYIIGPTPIKGGYLIVNCDKNEEGYYSKLSIVWNMKTICGNCGKTLSDEKGRHNSAHFDSSLPNLNKDLDSEIMYARCERCYNVAKLECALEDKEFTVLIK